MLKARCKDDCRAPPTSLCSCQPALHFLNACRRGASWLDCVCMTGPLSTSFRKWLSVCESLRVCVYAYVYVCVYTYILYVCNLHDNVCMCVYVCLHAYCMYIHTHMRVSTCVCHLSMRSGSCLSFHPVRWFSGVSGCPSQSMHSFPRGFHV